MSHLSLPKEEKRPDSPTDAGHDTLKYHLLGPSLLKAGQDSVDQKKVRVATFYSCLSTSLSMY